MDDFSLTQARERKVVLEDPWLAVKVVEMQEKPTGSVLTTNEVQDSERVSIVKTQEKETLVDTIISQATSRTEAFE